MISLSGSPQSSKFLAGKDKTELERLQKTAKKIYFTDTELYEA